MRIVYDARHFGPGATGIGRYSHFLLTELQKLDDKNEYFVLLQKKNFDSFALTAPNFQKILVDIPIYGAREQLLLPSKILSLKPDLVHFPHFNVPVFYPGRFIVTIHDLIVSEFGGRRATTHPLPLYLIKRLGYHLTITSAVKRAAKIITPSNYVKNRMVAAFGVPGEKVAVTYEAAALPSTQARTRKEAEVENVLGRLRIQKPYLLYVGLVSPHKNVSRLLEAIAVTKTHLVIVSPRTVFIERLKDEIAQKGVGKYVQLVGYVSDPDLIDLYRQAYALVFPSLSEGFGLPAVEAMSFGCPVLCSNVSSLPEVAGEAALFFDPYDPRDIAEKITQILKDKKLRAGLVKKGLAQAKKYSWETMAKQTLRVYEKVAAE